MSHSTQKIDLGIKGLHYDANFGASMEFGSGWRRIVCSCSLLSSVEEKYGAFAMQIAAFVILPA
eukprot:1452803-Amphidinium_carterae.1